jgi:hypothetical protein
MDGPRRETPQVRENVPPEYVWFKTGHEPPPARSAAASHFSASRSMAHGRICPSFSAFAFMGLGWLWPVFHAHSTNGPLG